MGDKTVFFDQAEADSRHFTAIEYARVAILDRAEYEREAATLLKRAQEVAPDPTVFEEHAPWFWRMIASTDRIDSYGTKMMPSSLRNYAADYSEGRAFLIGHDKRVVPTGYSLQGRYVAGQGGGVPRTEVDLYALTGLDPVDFAVKSMRGGTLRDASISFSGGRWICSIDGNDMLRASWEDCWHFPGAWYRKEDGKRRKDKKDEMVQCIAFIEDARAHEVSGVYDGATPGAGVVKALRAAEAGLIDRQERMVLEAQYRINLPGRQIFLPAGIDTTREVPVGEVVAGGTGTTESPPGGEQNATVVATPEAQAATERANAEAAVTPPPPLTPETLAGLVPRAQVEDAVRALGLDPGQDALAALRSLADEMTRLRKRAAFGEEQRQALIKETLDWGVRALGNAFNRDSWQTQLSAHEDYATLIAFRDNFKAMGEARLPNGRATVDGPAAEPPRADKPAVPNAAYRI